MRRNGVKRAMRVLDGEDRVPLLVIDGRPVSWMEFGEMLMTFEGWQFKLEIYDLSEDIGDDSVDRSRFLMRRDSRNGDTFPTS